MQIEILLRERQTFEDEIYDLLVSPLLFISEDFWEPVKVSLSEQQINKMKHINNCVDCFICKIEQTNFKILDCCKNRKERNG